MEQIIGNWRQVKKDALVQWDKLTESQLNMVNGEASRLADLICDNYGYTKEDARKQVSEFLERTQKRAAA